MCQHCLRIFFMNIFNIGEKFPFHRYLTCLIFSATNDLLLTVCAALKHIAYDSGVQRMRSVCCLQLNFKKLWRFSILNSESDRRNIIYSVTQAQFTRAKVDQIQTGLGLNWIGKPSGLHYASDPIHFNI